MLIAAMFVLSCLYVSADEKPVEESVLHIMETDIVPAADILWGADDPQSKEEWESLDAAAENILRASQALSKGGSGPGDKEWASDARWQSLLESLSEAAHRAQAAIRKQDLDALYDAGDELYPPCETCHKLFNPALVNQ